MKMQKSIICFVFAPLCFVTAAYPQDRSQAVLIEDAGFVPSGWMGDGAVATVPKEKRPVQVDLRSQVKPHTPPYSEKWSYRPDPKGEGWVAVAWQYGDQNWGDKPGKDWSKNGFKQVSVWARGVPDRRGALPRVQFKAGGGSDPAKKYHASFEVEGDFVTLTEEWKQYTLDLRGKNLSQVIAAFVMVIRAQDLGPEGATLYLDDIEYR
ncbi:MAG: hypothetical protein NTY38_12100 [Acidobacteria bacterium]|nr:hypothetical protein [Acidobacteriota bacterium]